ncbi:Protein polyglycylase TTLL10 (Tubulin--tyrosine ligase-like protein 10), partial [Durusdinium trenchii]
AKPAAQGNTGLLDDALGLMGYNRLEASTMALYDEQLRWLVAPHLECEAATMKQALADIPDLSNLVLVCASDAQWVNHMGHKDMLADRLRQLDAVLRRESGCILSKDFMLPTYSVSQGTDLGQLERELVQEERMGSPGVVFVVKHQRGFEELAPGLVNTLPLVSESPIKAIKHLRKKGRGDTEGLVVQPFKTNPLLWEGKRFTMRTWAFVLSSEPLVALYHDGVILRSLEEANSRRSPPKHKQRKGAGDLSFFANVTTRQHEHPAFAARREEAFGCMEDLQAYISTLYKSTEMQHFVALILKPYLKRLMLFVMHALRREHRHEAGTRAMQFLCFDFVMDSNWNVWLLDLSSRCNPQLGGVEYGSLCKRDSINALGAGAVRVAEQVRVARQGGAGTGSAKSGWLDHVDLGPWERLVDETRLASHPSSSGPPSMTELCSRATYQDFRGRQTFSKRAVQSLFPVDGHPNFASDHDLGMDRAASKGPWTCSVCGYLNHAKAQACDNCGSLETPVRPLAGQANQPHSSDGLGEPAGHEENEHKDRQGTVGRGNLNHEFDDYFAKPRHDPVGNRRQQVPPRQDSHSDPDHPEARLSRGKVTKCASKSFEIMHDVELAGLAVEPLRTSTHHACCSSCAINSKCKGFTYNAEHFECFLKLSLGESVPAFGKVSGIPAGETGHDTPSLRSFPDTARERGGFISSNFDDALVSDRARRGSFRKELVDLFTRHDPQKLGKVDMLLERYRGNEERFIENTRKQYEEIDRLVQERLPQHRARIGQQSAPLHSSGAAGADMARDVHGITMREYRDR